MKANLVTPIDSAMGYAEMGRRTFHSFRSVFDLSVTDLPMQQTAADLGSIALEMRRICRPQLSTELTVVNMVPVLWDRYLQNYPLVGYTTFEASLIPKSWVDKANLCPAVLTTSDWNAEVMKASGVKVPVLTLSPAFEPKQAIAKKDGIFRFFSSFQWSQRKNPEGLIRAYIAAFEGRNDVELVIKTHIKSGNEQAEIAALIKNVAGRCLASKIPPIRVISDQISFSKNEKIAAECDCYIGLSFGEGWGLPAWEAAERGQPAILTGWGAYSDWAAGSPLLVDSRTQPIFGMEKSVSPFFNSSMRWGDPSIDHAVDLMRAVKDRPDWAKESAAGLASQLQLRFAKHHQINSLTMLKDIIDSK